METFSVKYGLTNITSEALAERGDNHVTMCTGLAWLTLPAGFLASLTSACDELRTLDEEVLFHGGKLKFEEKHASERTVKKIIRELGGFVNAQCNGELAKVLATGFQARSKGTPVLVLDIPGNLRPIFTNVPHEVELRWNVVPNAINYKVYVNGGDPLKPEGWTLVGYTSKTRFVVTDLESATYYNFRVQAQGRKSLVSAMSQTVRGLAA